MGVTSELLHAKPMVGRTYIVCTPKFFSADPRKTEQRFLESVYVQTSILEGASADLERTPDQAWPGGCPASANPRLFLLQPRKPPPHLRRNLPMFQSAAPRTRVHQSTHTQVGCENSSDSHLPAYGAPQRLQPCPQECPRHAHPGLGHLRSTQPSKIHDLEPVTTHVTTFAHADAPSCRRGRPGR
jgi:hypothetical protein